MAKKYCPKCRHIRKITHNKKAKCCACGLSILSEKLDAIKDREKIKMIRFEMRMK